MNVTTVSYVSVHCVMSVLHCELAVFAVVAVVVLSEGQPLVLALDACTTAAAHKLGNTELHLY